MRIALSILVAALGAPSASGGGAEHDFAGEYRALFDAIDRPAPDTPEILEPAGARFDEPVTRGREYHQACLVFGDDVPAELRASLHTLLERVPRFRVDERCESIAGAFVLAVGRTRYADRVFDPEWWTGGEDQTLALRVTGSTDSPVIVAVGRDRQRPELANGLAAFEALARMGFSFLHPLDPIIPRRIRFTKDGMSFTKGPRWPVRGIHLHTMHPTELADLLNGFGPRGYRDDEAFRRGLPRWRAFLEWMLANKLNRVQWALLWDRRWADFSESSLRHRRLAEIVDMAHRYGIEVGIDAPITFRQQNAFRLLRRRGQLEDERREIAERVDWLMSLGLDFLALEIGDSEFTHPSAKRTLAWLDHIAAHLFERHDGARATVKVHVSSGQTTTALDDPETGDPLNVNFLPYYADRRLGVMPHTVQYYGLDDPLGVYGNIGFNEIERYMRLESGRREVLWYPETAYWCSFDVDVPLFLPIYAERRLSDLRRLDRGRLDAERPIEIDGQVFFSSGWEWGYWLGDVVAARASWDPLIEVESDAEAFERLLEGIFESAGEAADPLARVVAEIAREQRRLLVIGANEEGRPHRPELTGQPYLQGTDALDELAEALEKLPGISVTPTQPPRADVFSRRLSSFAPRPETVRAIAGLLAEIGARFDELHRQLRAVRPRVSPEAVGIHRELVDASEITVLRSRQVLALMLYRLSAAAGATAEAGRLATRSRQAIEDALRIVRQRSLRYRVPVEEIGAWRENPTAYDFGYLWPVETLYYWRRDHLFATDERAALCFGNIFDPLQLALGHDSDGALAARVRRVASRLPGLGRLFACFEHGDEPFDGRLLRDAEARPH